MGRPCAQECQNEPTLQPTTKSPQISERSAEAQEVAFLKASFHLRTHFAFVNMHLHKQREIRANYNFIYTNCIVLTPVKSNTHGSSWNLFGNQVWKPAHPDPSQPSKPADNKGRQGWARPGTSANNQATTNPTKRRSFSDSYLKHREKKSRRHIHIS